MIYLLRTFVTSLSLQLVFFTIAAIYKTDKFTDLSYGLTFIIITILLVTINPSPSYPQFILAAIIIIWGMRLAAYLLIRIIKTGKDKRFDGIRENFLKFARFWFFQAIAVWVIMFPATFALSSRHISPNIITVALGSIVWLTGFVIETVSDNQKSKFKEKNPNGFIDSGLWKYSRHPNYFGEILIWWGIFFFSIPYLKGMTFLSIIGPLFITFLLLRVTGIPPLEKAYDKRYGKDKKYREYKRKTSLLIPMSPKKINNIY